MRDEDEGCETLKDTPHNNCTQKSFNARCTESNDATNASDGVDYAVGTMVWTLFDYYGEPPQAGPEVSSTYGQFDLCGFPKGAAFWYRTQWLLSVPDGPDKTFATGGAHEVYIVESWEGPDSFPETHGNKTRAIHAYTSAPFAELFVNDRSQGVRRVRSMLQARGSYAEWHAVPWEAGTLTAVGRDKTGNIVAQDVRHTNGPAASLTLSIDVPSIATGTGAAVVLDGQDVALLHASVVDATGHVVHLASHNITFRVVSGPGIIQGTHNGNPRSQQANNKPWHLAYHGLVRAVVRVTSVSGRSAHERALASRIDIQGPMSLEGMAKQDVLEGPIVVEASSPGFDAVNVSIPVSTEFSIDGVLKVAEAMKGKPVDLRAFKPGRSELRNSIIFS